MNDNKCNGWTNYETWLFWLWCGDSISTVAELNEAKEQLEEQVDIEASLVSDLLLSAINSINWRELEEHIG